MKESDQVKAIADKEFRQDYAAWLKADPSRATILKELYRDMVRDGVADSTATKEGEIHF